MRSNPAIPGNNRRRCGCSRSRVREQPPKVRLFPLCGRCGLADIDERIVVAEPPRTRKKASGRRREPRSGNAMTTAAEATRTQAGSVTTRVDWAARWVGTVRRASKLKRLPEVLSVEQTRRLLDFVGQPARGGGTAMPVRSWIFRLSSKASVAAFTSPAARSATPYFCRLTASQWCLYGPST